MPAIYHLGSQFVDCARSLANVHVAAVGKMVLSTGSVNKRRVKPSLLDLVLATAIHASDTYRLNHCNALDINFQMV